MCDPAAHTTTTSAIIWYTTHVTVYTYIYSPLHASLSNVLICSLVYLFTIVLRRSFRIDSYISPAPDADFAIR